MVINNNPNTRLPTEVGDTFLFQEADMLTIENKLNFMLQCNMKFDVCVLELSGKFDMSRPQKG